jgi:putative hemolysin
MTILIGNNVANIVGSSLLTIWASRYFPDHLSLVVAVYTGIVIIAIEILPKLWGAEWSSKVAPYALRFLMVIDSFLKPVTWLVDQVTKPFVAPRRGRDPWAIGEEDLENTIEMARKGGRVDNATIEALANLIDFKDRFARDIMVPRSKIQALSVSATQDEIFRFIVADGHSRYPIFNGTLDNIVGILVVKDLLAHIQKGGTGLWTRMVRKPFYVTDLTSLGVVLKRMRRLGSHQALVRNETGLLVGLLTLEDILEEIVGEIRDEGDDPEPSEEGTLSGSNIVSGEIPILDFNSIFKASLPIEGSYTTVNGYLLARAGGEIPPVGTLVFTDDINFRIHSVSDQGVATIEILRIH